MLTLVIIKRSIKLSFMKNERILLVVVYRDEQIYVFL